MCSGPPRPLAQAIPVFQQDELLSFLPLSHIAERMFSVYMHLRFMYTVNFIENTDTVTENVVEVSPTVFFAVPRIWEKYSSAIFIRMKDATWFKRLVFGLALKIGKRRAKARLSEQGVGAVLALAFALAHAAVFNKLKERLGLERVRLAVSGAAPISPDVLRFYHAIGLPLRQVYGQTEDTGPTSIHHGDLIEADNVGPAVPGVQVKIAPDGEILVKGENVFLGYFRNPEATTETLEEGWLHSGDVGELDQRGYLTITDRKKDLIITSGGKNIAPQYLENKLKFKPLHQRRGGYRRPAQVRQRPGVYRRRQRVQIRPGQQDTLYHLRQPHPGQGGEGADRPGDRGREQDSGPGGADKALRHPAQETLGGGRRGHPHHEG